MKTQADKIRAYILQHVEAHPTDLVAQVAEVFAVTRTTVHRHLKRLCDEGHIVKSGTTRAIKYFLGTALQREMSYSINSHLDEYEIFQNDFSAGLKHLPKKIYDIINYGFTEILNNAFDHSRGSKVIAKITTEGSAITITITDNGMGIFQNIYNYFKLEDIYESVLQLNKGKMTTDPANHTGEGIFFSSRVFDIFEIFANKLHYLRDNVQNDWALEQLPKMPIGSQVRMRIDLNSAKDLVTTFKKYQEPGGLAFDRTDILVALSQFGNETLISRSQAKRIVKGLEKFNHVTLDFSGIRLVGQGFVDEIFRVYANAHPNVQIDYIHTNEDVQFMIKRGINSRLNNR